MNVNTLDMRSYADFLEENSRQIINLCNQLEENLSNTARFLDKNSSLQAVNRMAQNLENIKNNVPINDDACKRLVLSLRHIIAATDVFGGRSR